MLFVGPTLMDQVFVVLFAFAVLLSKKINISIILYLFASRSTIFVVIKSCALSTDQFIMFRLLGQQFIYCPIFKVYFTYSNILIDL